MVDGRSPSPVRDDGAGRDDVPVRDEGAASLLVVALTGVVLLLGLSAAFMTAAGAGHRRAQAGADLAALAGADSLQHGGDACAAADRVADHNGADLVACGVEGADVLVTVRVEGPEFLGHTFEIRGRARAGPGSAGVSARRGSPRRSDDAAHPSVPSPPR